MTWYNDFTWNIDRNEMKLHEILHIMKKYGCTKCDKMMEILIKMPGLHKVENTTCGCEKKLICISQWETIQLLKLWLKFPPKNRKLISSICTKFCGMISVDPEWLPPLP